jgi:hypothetical protein
MSRLVALLVTGDPERDVVDFSPATLVCCAEEATRWSIKWMLGP